MLKAYDHITRTATFDEDEIIRMIGAEAVRMSGIPGHVHTSTTITFEANRIASVVSVVSPGHHPLGGEPTPS